MPSAAAAIPPGRLMSVIHQQVFAFSGLRNAVDSANQCEPPYWVTGSGGQEVYRSDLAKTQLELRLCDSDTWEPLGAQKLFG